MLTRVTCIGTCAYLGGVWAVPEDFCWAWGALREFNEAFLTQPGETIYYTRAKFSLHAGARNMLAETMRGAWLFMTDTDHSFAPEVVYVMVSLMQRYHTPVLTGVYRHKALPHHPMLWVWQEAEHGFVPLAEYDPHVDIFQVDAAGAGCLLIHRRVFEQLRARYPDEGPFDHRGKYGEDMSFFLRCREAGIPVYATPRAETIHLRAHGITDADYVPAWWPSTEIVVRAERAPWPS